MRAGFAPVLLNPINFDALYQQQKEGQAETPPRHGETLMKQLAIAVAAGCRPGSAAFEFVSVAEPAILYDANSLKAKKLFVATRYLPLEQIVSPGELGQGAR